MSTKKLTPKLSVVVIFFNMPREAKRTLFSLSSSYQRNVDESIWEVIAIDNGSSQPLDENEVIQYGNNFRYYYFDTQSKSPVDAINFGVTQANGELVSICIDGARILTPGVIRYTLDCFSAFASPFVCTLAWHLGNEIQNISMMKGYNQIEEDKLLDMIDWRNDGYKLFDISALAGSSEGGFFSSITESNFFTLRKSIFERERGYDTRFTAPGGGTANLDFYKRIAELPDIDTVHLLGEGTFHQFHGGVAANAPPDKHPKNANRAQYASIRGEKFTRPNIQPVYVGSMPEQAKRFISQSH